MNIFAGIKTFIYLISSCLLYPTLFILVILTLLVIIYAGGLLAELYERIHLKRRSISEIKDALKHNNLKEIFSHPVILYFEELKNIITHLRTDNQETDIEYQLQKSCADLTKTLDKLKIIIRLGPALGLIGTLIPMGTGLAGLSQGDMNRLTSDLVIAFTTTVVGLALGMTAYCFYILKKRWYDDDIRNMEYLTEIVTK